MIAVFVYNSGQALLLVEWYTTFNRSKSATAWTVAILTGVRLITGDPFSYVIKVIIITMR